MLTCTEGENGERGGRRESRERILDGSSVHVPRRKGRGRKEERKKRRKKKRQTVTPSREGGGGEERIRRREKERIDPCSPCEERTYRDVNQPVIKISEGFTLNGPVTFIRPRFFDELSQERAPLA